MRLTPFILRNSGHGEKNERMWHFNKIELRPQSFNQLHSLLIDMEVDSARMALEKMI